MKGLKNLSFEILLFGYLYLDSDLNLDLKSIKYIFYLLFFLIFLHYNFSNIFNKSIR